MDNKELNDILIELEILNKNIRIEFEINENMKSLKLNSSELNLLLEQFDSKIKYFDSKINYPAMAISQETNNYYKNKYSHFKNDYQIYLNKVKNQINEKSIIKKIENVQYDTMLVLDQMNSTIDEIHNEQEQQSTQIDEDQYKKFFSIKRIIAKNKCIIAVVCLIIAIAIIILILYKTNII